jgi:hypothetical protein
MNKKAMELTLEALEKWDATIEYQYPGSKAGVLSRKDAMPTARAAIAALKESIKMQLDDAPQHEIERVVESAISLAILAIEESQPPETTPWDCVDAIRKKFAMAAIE